MMFVCYEIALNQNIQDKLREEMNEVLADYDDEVTYEAIMAMKYLDMVFSESLRKYPVVDSQFRRATKDFAVPDSKLVIPKGTSIMVPSCALHNDERFWVKPDEFDPERFTPENIKKIVPFSYIPFSEGPRQCIGLR
jgi:cytochrome P450 family 6